MKSIIHFSSWEDMQRASPSTTRMMHLVTYDVQTMNGEYCPMVAVYKNRDGRHGMRITQEQYRILLDCVLNDKPQPDFMMSDEQKAQKIANDLEYNRTTRRMWNCRLKKLEDDLFPNMSLCILGECDLMQVRLSRIEKKLGINQGPGDDLGRIEQCEFYLKNTYWRLNKLDKEIYPTQKDINEMPGVITIDGWCQKFENRLGVNLAFTDLDHRLKHIEDAWECTKNAPMPSIRKLDDEISRLADIGRRLTKLEAYLFPTGFYAGSFCEIKAFPIEFRLARIEERLVVQKQGDTLCRLQHCETIVAYMEKAKPKAEETPYVCPVLKDQKALQDALQDFFGNKTTLKPVGYRFYLMGRTWEIRQIYVCHNLYEIITVDGEAELEWLMPVWELESGREFSTKPHERKVAEKETPKSKWYDWSISYE
jgi:hypothetical protein